MLSSNRPKRNCRNRAVLSQPIAPTTSLRHAQITSNTQNVISSSPVLIQPSPRPSLRTRSRTNSLAKAAPIQLDSHDSTEEHVVCPLCAIDVDDSGLMCDRCNQWFHYRCLYITEDEFNNLGGSEESWFCDHCKSVFANRIKWGSLEGEQHIYSEIQDAYKEITSWKKNIFMLPHGKAGTEFIRELTRLINLFVHQTKWERLAIPLVHVFLPLMLQKPSKTSKARDHAKYVLARLDKWKAGAIKELVEECRAIQKRMVTSKKRNILSNRKAFCRLMLAGKVKQALKFINNDNNVKGVHAVNDEIKSTLRNKHPKAENALPESLLPSIDNTVQNVIFENISAELIQKCSRTLHGSGGPTQIDSDVWKHIICSKSYGREPLDLAEAIANLAKRLCCENIHPHCLTEFTSSRLLPLDKGCDSDGNPGVRPIGIGEVLRRIISKSVLSLLKTDVQNAAGTLQMCTGLRSGIEASVHMANSAWNDPSTEAMLFVDADNAFNRLNRKAALHNVKQLCPALHTFLMNHYQSAADLIVPNADTGSFHLSSEEGCTQGDVLSMALYALGIKPLVSKLACCVPSEHCKQSWYADDSSAAGKIFAIKKWWDTLTTLGPKFGYFPKPQKTALLVKTPQAAIDAAEVFRGAGIQITAQGHRHLGAAIGTTDFKMKYVTDKVTKWIADVKELSTLAVEEPQVALSAFTKGICHRWTFVQRTIPDISNIFIPLEECIKEDFIPAVIGFNISDVQRNVFSLPVRYGGLGIANPVDTCDREYQASLTITKDLSDLIYAQEQDLSYFDSYRQANVIREINLAKEIILKEKFEEVVQLLPTNETRQSLQMNREKGSGSWLTVLPLQEYGYTLNKQEFRDALCLRYGWNISNMPHFCGCGIKNSINHTLICKKGGYVAMRHNNLRDLNITLQKEVCRDVVSEPRLLPLENEEVDGTQADRAAPDISSRGLWSTFQRTFFDVRVLHPNAPSYRSSDLDKLYKTHEQEKMRKYNSRVITVEGGSFTPLIYTTFGGMGPQATKYHKRLAEKLARKRNENYNHTINHMRTRIRFSLLRSVLIAVRGERGRKEHSAKSISSASFNLIPDALEYESP